MSQSDDFGYGDGTQQAGGEGTRPAHDDEFDDEFDIEAEQNTLERRMMGFVAAGIVVAFAGIILAVIVFFTWARATRAHDDAERTKAGLAAVAAALDAVRIQVEDLGEEPVTPPSEEIVEDVETGGAPVLVPGPEGPQGEPGEDPSSAEVERAVNVYCARQPGGTCEGPPGPQGDQGDPGTIGEPGTAGAAGEPGQPGADGAPGPGPTDEQVLAAVTAFCTATGACVGPIGPAGPQGEPGEPGGTCAAGFEPVIITIPSEPDLQFQVCAQPGG